MPNIVLKDADSAFLKTIDTGVLFLLLLLLLLLSLFHQINRALLQFDRLFHFFFFVLFLRGFQTVPTFFFIKFFLICLFACLLLSSLLRWLRLLVARTWPRILDRIFENFILVLLFISIFIRYRYLNCKSCAFAVN